MRGLALVLLFGCDGQPAPTAEVVTPETSATPSPAQDEPTPAPAVATVYSAQNIDALQPQLPAREGRARKPLTDTPQLEVTRERLAAIVDQFGGDPDNPWAIGHGLVARGANWSLSNGENAVDWLFSQYAEQQTLGGATVVRFPTQRGGARIEPHAELMLKMLTEIDVSPDRMVTVQGHTHPIADLYRGAVLDNYLEPSTNHSSFDSPDDVAWALQGLAAWGPSDLVWVSAEGTPMSLRNFALFNGAVLKQETQPIAQAMAVGANFERQGQGIFRYTCGGAHLLQSVGYAVARGVAGEQLQALFAEQIELAFYRLPRELEIYDAAARRFPDQSEALLVQRLKFTGHFLESMYKFEAMGLFEPTEEQLRMLNGTAMQVALTTEAMLNEGVIERMPTLKQENEQRYLDVIGDAAHALHGLELGLGLTAVRY